MQFRPLARVSVQSSLTAPVTLSFDGTLNAGNTHQADVDMGVAAPPSGASVFVMELLSFSMTNYLGIETQAVTAGLVYGESVTFLNEFSFGPATFPQVEWNPQVLSYRSKMLPYDGVTDYAGTSGVLLSQSWDFDLSGGNGLLLPAENQTGCSLGVTAFLLEHSIDPSDGVVLTTKYTKWNGTFRYYYL